METIKVNKENLKDYLGNPIFESDIIYPDTPPVKIDLQNSFILA